MKPAENAPLAAPPLRARAGASSVSSVLGVVFATMSAIALSALGTRS
jgi:hypothetical protein